MKYWSTLSLLFGFTLGEIVFLIIFVVLGLMIGLNVFLSVLSLLYLFSLFCALICGSNMFADNSFLHIFDPTTFEIIYLNIRIFHKCKGKFSLFKLLT